MFLVNLADGTHFRYHARNPDHYRVSFDQTDREAVWGVIRKPADRQATDAQYIADFSAGPGSPCREIVSITPT